MIRIDFTIATQKEGIVREAMAASHPIPLDEEGIPLFTKSAWVAETLKQFIRTTVLRDSRKKAINKISNTVDRSLIL